MSVSRKKIGLAGMWGTVGNSWARRLGMETLDGVESGTDLVRRIEWGKEPWVRVGLDGGRAVKFLDAWQRMGRSGST